MEDRFWPRGHSSNPSRVGAFPGKEEGGGTSADGFRALFLPSFAIARLRQTNSDTE